MNTYQLKRNKLAADPAASQTAEMGRSMAPPDFQLKASPIQQQCEGCDCDDKEQSQDELAPKNAEKVEQVAVGDASPQDLSQEELEEQGKNALSSIGYERLVAMCQEEGLVGNKKQDSAAVQGKMAGSAPLQRNPAAGAAAADFFWKWATAAGVASQADSPAPGPGDVVALGLLAVAAIGAGVVYMASKGNQADTGIMNEVDALIRAGTAATVCAALAMLMAAAKSAGDKKKMQRIKKTQKAKGCRHSRHS